MIRFLGAALALVLVATPAIAQQRTTVDTYVLARRAMEAGSVNRAPHLKGTSNPFDASKVKNVHFYVDTLRAFLDKPDPAVAAELVALLGGAATGATAEPVRRVTVEFASGRTQVVE